jgi:hypothetical protein
MGLNIWIPSLSVKNKAQIFNTNVHNNIYILNLLLEPFFWYLSLTLLLCSIILIWFQDISILSVQKIISFPEIKIFFQI